MHCTLLYLLLPFKVIISEAMTGHSTSVPVPCSCFGFRRSPSPLKRGAVPTLPGLPTLFQRTYRRYFASHERAIILVFRCQRSQRNSNGVTPNGGAKDRWGRLKRRFSTNIPATADRLKRCQLSSPVSVINF